MLFLVKHNGFGMLKKTQNFKSREAQGLQHCAINHSNRGSNFNNLQATTKSKTGMLPLGSENRNPHASYSETETGEKIAPTPNLTEDDELRAYKDKYTHFFFCLNV